MSEYIMQHGAHEPTADSLFELVVNWKHVYRERGCGALPFSRRNLEILLDRVPTAGEAIALACFRAISLDLIQHDAELDIASCDHVSGADRAAA